MRQRRGAGRVALAGSRKTTSIGGGRIPLIVAVQPETGRVARVRRTETGELGEADAIRLAQRGDAEAFERLYHLHSRRVYSLCLRMVGNPASAEDLAQEAFLQLFRKIQTFRGESAFSTWLHRLTVNVVLMRLRRRNVMETSLNELAEQDEDSRAAPHEVGAADLKLSGSVDRVNLERAVTHLPPGYRAVFLLHDVEGYEHNEIADMLGCSIGNSKSQLHKARTRLRELLQEAERDRAREERQETKREVDSMRNPDQDRLGRVPEG